MYISELANLMQSLHCSDAMNLDGGGSTLLYANNQIINRPSDASGPRKVVSAVLVRDRFKKKFDIAQIWGMITYHLEIFIGFLFDWIAFWVIWFNEKSRNNTIAFKW